MALKCLTGGGLNLNDLTSYVFVDLDVGPHVRGQSLIVPKTRGAPAVMANFWDEPTTMTLVIGVKGSSVANLVANAEAVRNEFTDKTNTIQWSLDDASQAAKTFLTLPSRIDPFINTARPSQIFLAVNSKAAVRWELPILRQAYYSGDTRVPVA